MATPQDIRNRLPITIAFVSATVMTALDSTIANVALPHMQGSLSSSQDEIIWVLTSYIMAQTIMTPMSGWLALKFGRKRTLQASIILFTIASMLCGAATTVPELVAFRILQGMAGAPLIPLSQALMFDLYEPVLLPRVMAIWSATSVLGPVVGPTLGGWLTEHLNWRWVFYVNLPIGILSALGLSIFMSRDEGGRQRPFDVLGFGSLAVFIAAFQLMLDRGPGQDWFYSPEIWAYAAITASAAWMFVIQAMTAEHPFFHRALFADANYVTTIVFGVTLMALLFATSALVPTLMQNLMGYSAMQSGWASAPRGLGSMLAFLAIPFAVARFGARTLLLVGSIGCIVSLWMMAGFDLSMTASPIMWSGFIQGAAMSLMMVPLSLLAYTTLDPRHRLEGMTLSNITRSLGSSAGLSIVQALVIRSGATAHSRLAEHVAPSDPVVREALPPFMDPSSPLGAMILDGEVARQGAMVGYVNVFAWLALATVVLLPMIMILKPNTTVRGR